MGAAGVGVVSQFVARSLRDRHSGRGATGLLRETETLPGWESAWESDSRLCILTLSRLFAARAARRTTMTLRHAWIAVVLAATPLRGAEPVDYTRDVKPIF